MKILRNLTLASFLLTAIVALARPADKGYITVDANPRTVSVFVDGRYLGPASDSRHSNKYELPIGPHVVRLAQDGYQESTQHIYVTPGHVTTLAIVLGHN